MGARVAVVVSRDSLAGPIIARLQHSLGVDVCERAPHDPAAIDAAAFSRYDAIVYSALPADGPDTGPDTAAARAICERLASVPLAQVVVISSAAVYAPQHQHTGLLSETSFIAGGRSAIADDWRAVERLTEMMGSRSGAAAPGRVVLRPAAVLDGTDYFSRLLTGRLAVTYCGHDPTIQFLSVGDLADAVAAAVAARRDGIWNVAPLAGIPLTAALRLARVARLPIGRVAQNAIRAVTSQAGLAVSPDQLKYIQYCWTISGARIRDDIGFVPSKSSADAIVELTGHGQAPARPYDEFGMDPDYIRRYCGHLF
ncbi:MAG TPA: hypothetical protein VFZ98_11505, partial [Vicinamibacterales bacterium]